MVKLVCIPTQERGNEMDLIRWVMTMLAEDKA